MFYFQECDRHHLPGRPSPSPSTSGVPRQAMFHQASCLPPSLPHLTDLLFRLLSQSVHQTLKQLQKEQYEARVAQLVKRNRVFYRLAAEQNNSFSFFSVLFLFFSILSRIRNSMKTSFQFNSGDRGYASLAQPL